MHLLEDEATLELCKEEKLTAAFYYKFIISLLYFAIKVSARQEHKGIKKNPL